MRSLEDSMEMRVWDVRIRTLPLTSSLNQWLLILALNLYSNSWLHSFPHILIEQVLGDSTY